MSDTANIARPYARAVFELAREQDDLAAWGARLDALAAIAADPAIAALTANPRVSAAQVEGVINELAAKQLGDKANAQAANLVKLLARNRRIGALPDIARAFAALRAEAERVIEARMTTAAEMNEAQCAQFAAALETRLGRAVKLEFAVDRELVGGAVVRAGDWVVDGSVRSQLEQLVGALRA